MKVPFIAQALYEPNYYYYYYYYYFDVDEMRFYCNAVKSAEGLMYNFGDHLLG